RIAPAINGEVNAAAAAGGAGDRGALALGAEPALPGVRGATHRFVQRTADREKGVVNLLGLQAATGVPALEAVLGVGLDCRGDRPGALLICPGKHDLTHQGLDRPALRGEAARQVIE